MQTDTLLIIVNPGPASETWTITGDASKCENESITLTYTAVANADEYAWDFDWVGGTGNVDTLTSSPSITIDLSKYIFTSPSEAVTILVAGINGCNVLGFDYPWSVPHNLTVYQNPDAAAGTDDEICDNFTIAVSATASVGNGIWSDLGTGPGTVTFNPIDNASSDATADIYGTYTLEWEENNGGCVDRDTVEVVYYEQPTVTPPILTGARSFRSATLAKRAVTR
jgi:hypothetical protein